MQFLVSILDRIRPYRTLYIIATDCLLVLTSFVLGFLLRFDFSVPFEHSDWFFKTITLVVAIRLTVFLWFRLHTRIWMYVSVPDVQVILKAVSLGTIIIFTASILFVGRNFPRSVLFIDWFLCVGLVSGVRLLIRSIRETYWRVAEGDAESNISRILIIGAGDAGEMLLRDLRRTHSGLHTVVGFADDDVRKKGTRIRGVVVLGTTDQLIEICRENEVDEIVLALPVLEREERRKIVRRCVDTGLSFKTVPSIDMLMQGTAKIGQLQEVDPVEVLGREPVHLDIERMRQDFRGKSFFVTGAGGSIGSELCWQLAQLDPERLVLYERAESNLFLLDHELKRKYPSVEVVPVVGDINDREQLDEFIGAYRPKYLFHAAAYKHVPLMEAFPLEGVRNNIFGSENVGRAAIAGDVEKMVFISTDKAVDPNGVMGMTKRLTECLLQSLNGGATKFIAVRFGNVLGSDGSVVPMFRSQLARGGPITVTDPRATRYFMLISEAAKLIIQSGVSAKGGEIFFLDMGEPVRIMDLAKKMIRLSGMVPSKDIEIEVSGLRPGEKLSESLVMKGEKMIPTSYEKIFEVRSQPFDSEAYLNDLEQLRTYVAQRDKDRVVSKIKEMVARS
ncbi:polysaccharide biosynthesis protein [Nitrospinota bacterium]